MPIGVDLLNDSSFCCPSIALLASENAHRVADKNGLDFSELLVPFTEGEFAQISIREPTGNVVSHRLRLDIRDIRRKGFLLEHSVFRFVLQEAILEHSTEEEEEGKRAGSILLQSFYSTFLHWQEPADHEYLRAYIGTIFLASTADADPLKTLQDLEMEQHQDQHRGGTARRRISPPYCAPPKWFFHQKCHKYFVLVHDNSIANLADESRCAELFNAVCARYGQPNCHLLILNSANPTTGDKLPDLWRRHLVRNNRGLREGVELAKRNLLHAANRKQEVSPAVHINHAASSPALMNNNNNTYNSVSVPQPSPSLSHQGISSTVAPTHQQQQLFTTQSPIHFQQQGQQLHLNANHLDFPPPHPLSESTDPIFGRDPNNPNGMAPTYAQIVEGASTATTNDDTHFQSRGLHGQWLSVEDRQRLRQMVSDLIAQSLVPFVERQLVEMYELVANRKSLTKSTFGQMRKWLSSATTNAAATTISALNNAGGSGDLQLQQHNSQISYSSESIEAQMRRTADLAFLFGLYSFALQIYQSMKKDFASEQAWLHHAGALEMAALASFLNDWRQFVDQEGGSGSINASPAKASIALAQIRKQYPQRYMDNAINYYAKTCRMPMLALRAMINGVQVLAQLEMYEEAARQLIGSVGTSLQLGAELFDAILLEHAARLYAQTGNRRRKVTFYLATAAIRISRFFDVRSSSQSPRGEEAVSSAAPQTTDRQRCKALLRRLHEEVLQSSTLANNGWRWAEDYLLCLYMACF